MLADGVRTYHDPLHGAIALSAADPVERLLIELIDTPAFQRLRRIRQLGTASLTFHGAEASRFTHSLGVMAIARRAFALLAKRYPDLQADRATVLCAALLHDVGHGPFSHTAEEIFGSQHEFWTAKIIQNDSPIRQSLQAFDPQLIPAILAVYDKRHPRPIVSQLVSSQLDCDRLDYLMRDSYFTGATYGKLDLDRILAALRYDSDQGTLVVAAKGQTAVEHYLIVRSFMYNQVYSHPKNIAATWLLVRAFHRASVLLTTDGPKRLSADATMTAWLTQPWDSLSLEDYLAADDGLLLYHLQRWQHCDDTVLADLSRRFIDRDLFKAKDVTQVPPEELQHIVSHIQALLVECGYPPEDYVGLHKAQRQGYFPYEQGIQIQVDNALWEIGERSPLVQALSQMHRQVWLIYPKFLEGL